MAPEVRHDVLLERAIDNADEHTLRTVLKSTCQASEECRKEVTKQMLVSRKRDFVELSDSSDDDTQKQNKKQKKVEVIRILSCEKCDTLYETYEVTPKNKTACQTHTGGLTIDADVSTDDDEAQDDVRSAEVCTEWQPEEWVEGFIWRCCEKLFNDTPCLLPIPKKG
ncbi:hypothetical protein F4803DRAFT_531231 [Xylaria telfairii]|nr:hypothetical protein F4803DRAFT_531231 [Xylaria telfairii]